MPEIVELRPNGAQSEMVFQLRDVAGAVEYERKFKVPLPETAELRKTSMSDFVPVNRSNPHAP